MGAHDLQRRALNVDALHLCERLPVLIRHNRDVAYVKNNVVKSFYAYIYKSGIRHVPQGADLISHLGLLHIRE